MKNEFKTLAFQSRIFCKRNGVPVTYYSNIVEIKHFYSTRSSKEFEVKKQPLCPAYPPCICHKKCVANRR